MMANQDKSWGIELSGKRIACWLFCIAHIAALTCISTALWQIWHALEHMADK